MSKLVSIIIKDMYENIDQWELTYYELINKSKKRQLWIANGPLFLTNKDIFGFDPVPFNIIEKFIFWFRFKKWRKTYEEYLWEKNR